MSANAVPQHKEEIDLGEMSPEVFIAESKTAAENLGWKIISAADTFLICTTMGVGQSFGEEVTVRSGREETTFVSKDLSSFYWEADKNVINAQLFMDEIARLEGRPPEAVNQPQYDTDGQEITRPNPLPEHKEEIDLGEMSPEEFIAESKTAAENLGWKIVSATGRLLLCQTVGMGQSFGECITVKSEPEQTSFVSSDSSSLYWEPNKNFINAQLFINEIARLEGREAEVLQRMPAYTEDGSAVAGIAGQQPVHPMLTISRWAALRISDKYMITPVIIYLNIAVFVIMCLGGVSPVSPTPLELLHWGGDFRPYILEGQYWRLFTSMFVHAGIVHLLGNMFALLYVGRYLEPLLGRMRYAWAYLLTGICASLLSVTMHEAQVAVGASGAIFGLFGVFLAMLTTDHVVPEVRTKMLRTIAIFIAYTLVRGMRGNVDNAAHIGGLLGGIAIGYAYYYGLKREHDVKKQMTATAVLAGAVVLLSAFTIYSLADDVRFYNKRMVKFTENEASAIASLNEAYKKNKEDALADVKSNCIPKWAENAEMLDNMQRLNLPITLRLKNKKLRQYCALRLEQCDLVCKQLAGDEIDDFKGQMKDYKSRINDVESDIKEGRLEDE